MVVSATGQFWVTRYFLSYFARRRLSIGDTGWDKIHFISWDCIW